MRWSELSTHPCPVARTLSVVGDRWTLLILRDAFRGVARFEDFHERLKCSRAIVAQRLAHLVDEGVLARDLYEAHPPRHKYRLTEMGRSLAPVLMTMGQWGEANRPVAGGLQVRRVHKACGCAFEPRLHCSECGEPVLPGSVEHVDPLKAREPA